MLNIFYIYIYIAENEVDGHLPFIQNRRNTSYLEIIEVNPLRAANKSTSQIKQESKPSVTRLTEYLTSDIKEKVMKYIRFIESSPIIDVISLKGLIKTNGKQSEEVCDINGIAIPAYFQSRITNTICTIEQTCINILTKMVLKDKKYPENHRYLDEIIGVERRDDTEIDFFLRLATIYKYVSTGFITKPMQIKNYNWLKDDDVERCIHYLNQNLLQKNDDNNNEDSEQIEFEVELSLTYSTSNYSLLSQVTIDGVIDVITDDTIWELKCTDSISDEHIIQLALYAYMYMHKDLKITMNQPIKKRKFKILNMKTGQVYELKSTYEELDKMKDILVYNFLKGNDDDNDDYNDDDDDDNDDDDEMHIIYMIGKVVEPDEKFLKTNYAFLNKIIKSYNKKKNDHDDDDKAEHDEENIMSIKAVASDTSSSSSSLAVEKKKTQTKSKTTAVNANKSIISQQQ